LIGAALNGTDGADAEFYFFVFYFLLSFVLICFIFCFNPGMLFSVSWLLNHLPPHML